MAGICGRPAVLLALCIIRFLGLFVGTIPTNPRRNLRLYYTGSLIDCIVFLLTQFVQLHDRHKRQFVIGEKRNPFKQR